MRKSKVFILLYLFNCAMFAQNFNLIYIQLDYEMDYSLVNQKLNYLISNELDNQDYVLIYANSFPVKIANRQADISVIRSQISSNQNFYVQMDIVKRIFLKTMLDNKMCEVDNDEFSSTNTYKKINFYCFVGTDFFDNGFHDNVFATFLFSSNLQKNKSISFYYYNTFDLTIDKIQFSEFYSNNLVNIELK